MIYKSSELQNTLLYQAQITYKSHTLSRTQDTDKGYENRCSDQYR
ncbi:hypothetical protein [Legionella sainthelensi]|nr:hypothetical protein [Legionella sainthelensi]